MHSNKAKEFPFAALSSASFLRLLAQLSQPPMAACTSSVRPTSNVNVTLGLHQKRKEQTENSENQRKLAIENHLKSLFSFVSLISIATRGPSQRLSQTNPPSPRPHWFTFPVSSPKCRRLRRSDSGKSHSSKFYPTLQLQSLHKVKRHQKNMAPNGFCDCNILQPTNSLSATLQDRLLF